VIELESLCDCGSQRIRSSCCAPYWRGEQPPPTPVALMRARYSAFALGRLDFLLATLHPSSHKPDEREQLRLSQVNIQWLGLQVLRADGCEVEFAAFFRQYDTLGQLHECSQFVFEKNQWWYIDGNFLPPIKWERNWICWCGGGKKFKKCHGND
jgi:SEC-C motif domain protein